MTMGNGFIFVCGVCGERLNTETKRADNATNEILIDDCKQCGCGPIAVAHQPEPGDGRGEAGGVVR